MQSINEEVSAYFCETPIEPFLFDIEGLKRELITAEYHKI